MGKKHFSLTHQFKMMTVHGNIIHDQRDFASVVSWLRNNIPQHTHGKWNARLVCFDSGETPFYQTILMGEVEFEKKEDAALFKIFWTEDLTHAR